MLVSAPQPRPLARGDVPAVYDSEWYPATLFGLEGDSAARAASCASAKLLLYGLRIRVGEDGGWP